MSSTDSPQLLALLQQALSLFQQGLEKRHAGLLQQSLALLDQATGLSPDHAELHLGRANVLLALNRRPDATEALKRVLALVPNHPQARMMLGQLAGAAAPTEPAKAPESHRPSRLKLSIVTPTYNCGRYIRTCIESVLAQGYDNFEHIIVDGASKDDTLEILKQYPHLKWISEPDGGEAEALNKGLRMA